MTLNNWQVNYMSLGWDCYLVDELKRMGFTVHETPVNDVGIRSLKGINRMFQTRFEKFFLVENLVYKPQDIEYRHLQKIYGDRLEYTDVNCFPVFDMFSDTIDIHHFSKNQSFKSSYDRFLKQRKGLYGSFFKKLQYMRNLKLIRTNYFKEKIDDIVELRNTISDLRAGQPFELIVIQGDELMMKNWGVPNLHTICATNKDFKPGIGWVGDKDRWIKIIKLLTNSLVQPTRMFV